MTESIITYCPDCATPAQVDLSPAQQSADKIREWCWKCGRYRSMVISRSSERAELAEERATPMNRTDADQGLTDCSQNTISLS